MENNTSSFRKRDEEPRTKRANYTPLIMACVLLIGIQIGFLVHKVSSGKSLFFNAPTTANGNRFDEILNLIQKKYVDTVNVDRLSENTINSMLSQLDPHTVYIPARELQDVNEDLEGNFEGIGIEFYIVKDTITVVSPIAGGPSEKAGLRPGDKIVQINDSLVAGIKVTNEMVMKKLKGKKGSQVKLGIARSGQQGLKSYNITRDKIPMYSVDVSYMLNAKTGYIKISKFSGTTYDEFMEAMNKLTKAGAGSLVIDLRQNPGGYLETAISILDELISGKKLLLYTKGAHSGREDYESGKDGIFETGKLSVLIDEGSASASEIVSGAIQDWDRGLIIGRRSFGKGLVQQQFELNDGSALRLTVAKYYIPSGRCIQKPYDKNLDDYYSEVYSRFGHGEMNSKDSIHLSDTTVYKTHAGRRVYGGGGIIPDIFIPLDTFSQWEYFNQLAPQIPEYEYAHAAEMDKLCLSYSNLSDFALRFQIPAEVYEAFLDYAHKSGVKANPVAEAALRSRTESRLKAYIAKQKWGNEGFYMILNADDKMVNRALQELSR